MAKRSRSRIVKVQDLDIQLRAVLDGYSAQATAAVDMLSEEAVQRIAELTKATAPKGARGSFKRHITSGKKYSSRYRNTYAWYVKPPDHRLTHLLVKGHATRDGGRTRSDAFLHNAVKEVAPWYEESLERVLSKGGKYK